MSYTTLMADFERKEEDVRAIHPIATLISDSEDGADDVDNLATPSISLNLWFRIIRDASLWPQIQHQTQNEAAITVAMFRLSLPECAYAYCDSKMTEVLNWENTSVIRLIAVILASRQNDIHGVYKNRSSPTFPFSFFP